MPDDALEIPVSGKKDDVMPEQLVEAGNLSVAMTILAQGAASAHDRRVTAWDQMAKDTSYMWSVALTSPTVMAGMGFQAAAGHMPPRQVETGTTAGQAKP